MKSAAKFDSVSVGDWRREHSRDTRPSPVLHQLGRALGKERFLSILHHSHQLLNEPATVPFWIGPEGPTKWISQLPVQLLVEDVN